jgi:hypothetical protein
MLLTHVCRRKLTEAPHPSFQMSAKVHLQAQPRQLTLDGKVDLGVDLRAVSSYLLYCCKYIVCYIMIIIIIILLLLCLRVH